MNIHSDKLSAYLSSIVLERIENSDLKRNMPEQVRFPAAVLFADISGFTTFTEELDNSGPEGIEAVAEILNKAFSNLISIVYEHGGDVVKFAGDALWAIWRGEADGLDAAIHQSLYCAQSIQKNHSILDDSSVNLRVSLSAGEISVLHVGGVFNRWEMIIAGKPLLQLGIADKVAKPGDICFAGVYPESLFAITGTEAIEDECYKITSVMKPENPPRVQIKTNISITDALRGYIPGAILKRLDAGQSEWLAEIRYVTVVFLRVRGLDYERPDSLEKTHDFMRKLQGIIYYYEGSLNRLNVDDKGTIMLAAFGLPPLSHDNDPSRAVNAMWEIRKMLHEMELDVSIGITTGRAFCGALGNEYRREYTMHGDIVNLSARLMQKSSEGWGILCDETTYRDVKKEYDFEALKGVALKGRKALADIYSPVKPLPRHEKEIFTVPCRQEEIDQIEKYIIKLKEKKNGGVVVIDGEPGIGKTTLIRNIVSRNSDDSLVMINIKGDSAGQNSPYFSIRTYLRKLIMSMHEKNQLSFPDHLKPYTSLLNTKSMSLFPETEEAKLLTRSLKLDLMKDLFLSVFQNYFFGKSVLFVADESQWIDERTFDFLQELHAVKNDVLFILISRTVYEPQILPQIMRDSPNIKISLGSLPDTVIFNIASQRIGSKNLSANLMEFFRSYSDGHPYYASVLADSLKDNNFIKIEPDLTADFTDSYDSSSNDHLFEPVLGIITEKIDRLAPEDQLVLKVASIVGREVSMSTLKKIFPIDIDDARLKKSLSELVKREFLILNSINGDYYYRFKRSLVQMAAYNMILFTQRKDIESKIEKVL